MNGIFKEFTPRRLAQIEKLDVMTKVIVDGFYSGRHGSRKFGQSENFADLRMYEKGDPLKMIDWKAYGRTESLHVRKFHDDSNMNSFILLDSSSSMGFASGSMSKFRYGSCLAAALTLIMLRQRDVVGFASFNTELSDILEPSSTTKQFFHIISILEQIEPKGQTALTSVIESIMDILRNRSLVIIISDLLELQCRFEELIAMLKNRGHDVLVLHTLDAEELSFQYTGRLRLIDPESKKKITMDAKSLQENYAMALQDFVRTREKNTREQGADYFLVNTEYPFNEVLRNILGRR